VGLLLLTCWLIATWREGYAAVMLLGSVAALAGMWHHDRWNLYPADEISRFADDAPKPLVVRVKVLSVDTERQRISLSIKQAQPKRKRKPKPQAKAKPPKQAGPQGKRKGKPKPPPKPKRDPRSKATPEDIARLIAHFGGR
jgi:hypothetical protein